MQQVRPSRATSTPAKSILVDSLLVKKKTNPRVRVLIGKKTDSSQLSWKLLGLGATALTLLATGAGLAYGRYGNPSLTGLNLTNETVDGHAWAGEDISFQQIAGNQFNVSFQLTDLSLSHNNKNNIKDRATELTLQNIDLSLMIPTVPATAHGNKALTQWFLTEREFNRQRVIFEPGSPHIQLPASLGPYAPQDISIALTNNCLGAGYWELAVYAQTDTGNEKIYQGYFTFSRRAYAGLINQFNPTHYWQQVRTMEAWPGFKFLSGLPFSLEALRTVVSEQTVPVTDLKSEPILAANEQVDKADLVVYKNETAESIETWEELRQADLAFHSFVPPGIYNPNRLWDADFSQLATLTQATARQVLSPLNETPLTELQLDFANTHGDLRQLIVSGVDLAQIPQLDSQDYSDGVYMPLGFGTTFTQTYGDLQAQPPSDSPFFSVLLNRKQQVIDYRQDIGINGIVMHRDADNANRLHLYLMSYERITLIGHYIVDLPQG